jgi:hypothetical protein
MRFYKVPRVGLLFRWHPTRPNENDFLGAGGAWDPRGATDGRPTTGASSAEDRPDVASLLPVEPPPLSVEAYRRRERPPTLAI